MALALDPLSCRAAQGDVGVDGARRTSGPIGFSAGLSSGVWELVRP